jgi:hypothetical protein
VAVVASAARPIRKEKLLATGHDRPLISPEVAALAEAIGMKVGLVDLNGGRRVEMALAESFSEKSQLFFLLVYDSFCMLMYLGSHL